MSSRPPRVQFRLEADAHLALLRIAMASGKPLSLVAKEVLMNALRKPTEAESQTEIQLLDDVLVCRAGMERLFERTERIDELQDAIARLRGERSVLSDGSKQGGARS